MRKWLLPLGIVCISIACNPPSPVTPDPLLDTLHTKPILIVNDSAWLAEHPALAANGVYYYDSCKAENGVTLLDEQTKCTLIDMNGKVLAKFPFGITHVFSDGTMIGSMPPDLVKFDADLDLLWKTKAIIHHEITTDENGSIYLLSSERQDFMGLSVRFDVLKIYSSDGDLIYEWKVSDHIPEFVSIISKSTYLNNLLHSYDPDRGVEEYISQDPERFFYVCNDTSCIFEFTHLNSIQVLPENTVSRKIPAFKKGNLLLSFNPYACYGILDTSSGNIEWVGYLPERTSLHTPLLTAKGTILIFQNSTGSSYWNNRSSRCLKLLHQNIHPQDPSPDPEPRNWVSISEYNPITNAKVWEYTANPKESLQAGGLGSVQRLPNGNTLVCAATDNGGLIFELTPEKNIVWSYLSPEKNPENATPLCFYRAKRISFDIAKKIIPGFKP